MPCQSLGKLSYNSWFHVCVWEGGGPVHFYNSIKPALRISHLCFNLISIHLAMPAIQIGRYTTQALRSFLKQYIRYGQLIWPVWGVNPAFFGHGPTFASSLPHPMPASVLSPISLPQVFSTCCHTWELLPRILALH